MNLEDYRDENTHTIETLRRENEKLNRALDRAEDTNGDLNIKILQLQARIKELENKYESN